MTKQFSVGTLVKAKKFAQFSTYDEWAKHHNMVNFVRNQDIEEDAVHRVVCFGVHGHKPSYGYIYGIENIKTGSQHIIGAEGLKEYKEFDITAPIERQYTRDGRKITALFDSGKDDVKYPVSAWVDGQQAPDGFTRDGKYVADQSGTGNDIVTRPKYRPLLTRYIETYISENGSINAVSFTNLTALRDAQRDTPNCTPVMVQEITHNPNDNTTHVTTLDLR
jgi:hypothetical protein